MNINPTISAILRAKWLISRSEAQHLLPIVANVIQGNTEFENVTPSIKIDVVGAAGVGKAYVVEDSWDLRSHQRNGRFEEPCIIVIPVKGAIMKHDQMCGPVGSMARAELIRSAEKIENIKGIVLDIDSAGGMVDGTQTLVDAIKESTKKTIAFINDGMACSAAYWYASACDLIYVSQKTDVVGSIGVYVTIADFKSYYESLGLKITDIYSNRSIEKNEAYNQAIGGNTDKIKEELDFIADIFINSIKASRTINLSAGNPFKGATYHAEEAMAIGLIDGIRSIDEVYNLAMNETNTTTTENTTDTMTIKEQMEAYAAASVEDRAAILTATEDTYGAEATFSQADLDAKDTAHAEAVKATDTVHTAAIGAKDVEITNLTAEVATLKMSSPEKPTVVGKKPDPIVSDADKDDPMALAAKAQVAAGFTENDNSPFK